MKKLIINNNLESRLIVNLINTEIDVLRPTKIYFYCYYLYVSG